jgi:hypothetical protein
MLQFVCSPISVLGQNGSLHLEIHMDHCQFHFLSIRPMPDIVAPVTSYHPVVAATSAVVHMPLLLLVLAGLSTNPK